MEFLKQLGRISYCLLVKVIVCLPLTIIGIPILAIGLLFVNKEATSLPKGLKWFDNGDGDGLIGDEANQQKNRKKGIDPNGYFAKFKWLALRNPINYFKHRVIGLKASEIVGYSVINEKSDVPGEFVSDYRSGGTRYLEVILKNGSTVYEYSWVKPYHLFGKSFCFRARIGTKLGHPNEPNKEREYYAFACSIHPIAPYRGKFPEEIKIEEKQKLVQKDETLVTVGETYKEKDDLLNSPLIYSFNPNSITNIKSETRNLKKLKKT